MIGKKFRVWNKAWGCILPVSSIVFDKNTDLEFVISSVIARVECTDGTVVFEDLHDFIIEEEEVILLQYIGLKDKNNKEIFEGDILSYKVFEESDPFFFSIDARFGTSYNDRDSLYGYISSDLESSEIVGNIYQNPELIK